MAFLYCIEKACRNQYLFVNENENQKESIHGV